MSPISRHLPATLVRAVRRQRRAAASTVLIVITLALAIGANAAVFTVADALLLRAVPFRDAGRLAVIGSGFPTMRLSGMGLSGPESLELAELTRAFTAVGALTFTGVTVQGANESVQASGVDISPGALDALGLDAAAGRLFTAEEHRAGGGAVAVLGHAFWMRALGGDPAAVGRTVLVNGTAHLVVGILPAGMTVMGRSADVWRPLRLAPGTAGGRSDHRYTVIARIRPDLTLQDAAADLNRASATWLEEIGEPHAPSPTMHPLEIQTLTRATTGVNREPIGALVAAVVFVLLIACANIANLLVARAAARRGELAIQVALGASRRRIVGESVGEGLLLAAAGSVGGLLLARMMLDMLHATWPALATVDLAMDRRMLLVTAVVATLAGLVIGIIPALRLDPAKMMSWLQSGGRGSIGAAGNLRLQRGLIALQIALAVLLSSGAAVMMRSLQALTAVDLGIDTPGVVRAQIALPERRYAADAQIVHFYDELLARISATPGVSGAAVMSGLPPQRRANNSSFVLDGNETVVHSAMHQVDFVQHVTPGYLSVLRIPLRAGRDLQSTDHERSRPVALVNETLAARFWPGEDPLGRRLKAIGAGEWLTVVGVVADVRQAGLQAPPGSEVYVTHRQARALLSGFMPRTMNVVVRGGGSPAAVFAGIRDHVRQIDPSAAVSAMSTMDDVVNRTIAQPRLLAWMFGAFAALALAVAAIGVYAVTACTVGARTAEFGVRMALGARPRDVMRLVVAGGLVTVAFGLAAGVAAAAAGSRLLQGLVFGVEPLDVPSLLLGTLTILAAAIAATVLPAGRAARVDPLIALRDTSQ